MRPSRLLRHGAGGLRRLAARFARARSGVAAVEFAVLAPLLMSLWFLLFAVTTMVIVNRKMTLVSRSLADLTARSQTGTIGTTELANIFAASSAILYPYDASTLQMVISSVRVNTTTKQAQYVWSCAKNNAKTNAADSNSNYLQTHATGTPAPLPAGFEKSPSFIYVETRLLHTPVVNVGLGRRVINENTPWPVRNVTEIALGGTCPT